MIYEDVRVYKNTHRDVCLHYACADAYVSTKETYKGDLQKRPTKETYKRDLLLLFDLVTATGAQFAPAAQVCVDV